MLAASAQPQPPHLLPPAAARQSQPLSEKRHQTGARTPMAPVSEVVTDTSPAPPGRLKTLFYRKSQGSAAATSQSSTSPTTASSGPAVTPPPPPPASLHASLDPPPPSLSNRRPTSTTPPGASNARARFKNLLADSTRPASQAVRALGQGFPSSSIKGEKQRPMSQPGPSRSLSNKATKGNRASTQQTPQVPPIPSPLPEPKSPDSPEISSLPQLYLPQPPASAFSPTSPSPLSPSTLSPSTPLEPPIPSPVGSTFGTGSLRRLGSLRRSSPRVSVVTPANPRDSGSTINGNAFNSGSIRRNLGRSLLKGSISTPSLTGKEKKGDPAVTPTPKAKDDTETRKKGRNSLALLFQGRSRTIVTKDLPLERPPSTPNRDSQFKRSTYRESFLLPATPVSPISPGIPVSPSSARGIYAAGQEASSSTPTLGGTPRAAANRPANLAALRSQSLSRRSSRSILQNYAEPSPGLRPIRTPYGNGIYSQPTSATSLSPISPVGMSLSASSLQRSRTSVIGSRTSLNASQASLSLSQTSLLLPEPSARAQILPKDHYHLRFASSYVINLITPALKTANFSKSERNMEVKRITEDRLALLSRMERTWGGSWADATGDLLNGSASAHSLELKETKLRACNITAAAKARERKAFVAAMRDGILFCFLFNRLFPSQQASIQRVKVPKDDARVAANINRFLSACREIGVGESDMFTLDDLDDNSPVGLARVSRTILILANMAPPSVAPRPRASRSSLKPPSTHSGEGSSSVRSSKIPSRPESPKPQSPTTPIASRALLERPLRSSSSDLHARLQRESSSSNSVNTASSASVGPAAGAVAAAAAASISNGSTSAPLPVKRTSQPSRLSQSSYAATPPLSPVRAVAKPTTPRTSQSAPVPQITPPTARPQRIATSKTQVSFKSDSTGSPHVSGHDWSSSISSNHSASHLAPLHERERTPSLVSTSSQVPSSYSRSSIRGSVPTILGEDPRPEDDYDQLDSATAVGSSLSLTGGRRLSEQTLQEARRRIIGTLLSSTDDLTGGNLEEARGFALSQSLAALEGARPALNKTRSDSPRIRPISRRVQSIDTPQNISLSPEESDSSPRPLSELPPRPRIRRSSVNGKIYVPKRANSPASPNLSLGGASILPNAALPMDPAFRNGKEERRRSEDYPQGGATGGGANRVMGMRNHSMINLPAPSRRASSMSQGSHRDSMIYPSNQILRFNEPGKAPVRYQLGNCIGRGQFGSVYRSLNQSTGQMMAIKRIRLSGMKETEVSDVMREVELLQRLTHPGIVKYEGMSRDDAFLNIVLEFVENGSLGQTLRAFGRFNERLVASYVAKILEGLHYLHSEGVVHCDLKAANILSTKNGNVKLTDFGVSLNMRAVEHFAERASMGRSADLTKSPNEIAGTPNWMAPEVIKLQGASPKSDIWSLGCTIVELLTGKPPYSDVGNSMTVLFRIVEDPLPPLPEGSPELQDFLKLCFAKNPEDRPTAALLFEHEWVKAGHADLIQRPQDSLPFHRRLSQEPGHHRVDSSRIFTSGGIRSASASLIDLHDPTRGESEAAETSRRAQMSMVSLHSNYNQSREGLDSSAAKAHALVKTTFAKSITCHVCLEGVKKSAYLCQNCGLITHAKCAPRANARCDVRGQLALLASQQDWVVAAGSSRPTSPGPETPAPSLGLGARIFGRNKSKSSLLAAPSTTSLVSPEQPASMRRRKSSGAGSSSSRPYLDASGPPDTVASFHSRHSETSEDAASGPRDRSKSLIRIDEDGPSHSPRAQRFSTGPPPVRASEGGTGPRRRVSMRLRPMRKDKAEKPLQSTLGRVNEKDREDGDRRSDCIIA